MQLMFIESFESSKMRKNNWGWWSVGSGEYPRFQRLSVYGKRIILEKFLFTLQQEAEDVEQEEYAHAVQVGEEPFVVHDGKLMSCDIADDVRNADDN